MRRATSFVILLILVSAFAVVHAQTMYSRRFQPDYLFGFKAGLNIANQYSPDSKGVFESKSITGITAGGYFTYFFSRILAIQPELSVSVKGSHWKELNYPDEKKDILTYIDLPLLLRYQPFSTISFHAGPQLSYLIRGMQYDYETRLKAVIEEYYKSIDLGFGIGAQASLPKNIDLTLRYVRGILSVDKSGGYNFKSYNNFFQVTAGYRFERDLKLRSRSRTNIRR